MTFPFKTSFSRWCSSSFPYAQSVHIFPSGPRWSHILPYDFIFSHRFPYISIFSQKKTMVSGTMVYIRDFPFDSLSGTVQVTCQLPVQREDHQSSSVPGWRELSRPQEIQAIFHTIGSVGSEEIKITRAAPSILLEFKAIKPGNSRTFTLQKQSFQSQESSNIEN